jgi:tripartite-type tricarboxylate transporter receptor subunit TctC
MKKIILIAVSFGLAVSSVRFAGAQTENYPAKPVRLIVPFPEGGAPASSEQGSRLRDANVRESGAGAVKFIAGVASVFGVASPKGARRRAEEGSPWGSDPEDAHRAGIDAPIAGSTVASPQVGPLLRVTPAPAPPYDGAPGLVSRRPARGEGVQAAGFYTIAAVTTLSYPEKPIRLIVPFPPGGSVDLIARLVAPKLSESLGQQIVIDNRSGASGNIGAELVARAAPDGYMLMVHTIPFVVNTFLYRRVPYDVLNDFAPVSLLSSSPSLLAVHPSLPVRSVRELLALAKSRPGALNYASAGVGTNPHIAGELFNYLGKVNIVAVQFKGGGPALIATISGEVGVTFTNFAETSAHVKGNRLHALGVSSTKRSALMPDVPTIAEAGLPGYEFVTWHGMLGPKGMPRAIVALLNERLKKTMGSPDQSQLFKDRGLDIIASSSEEFATHLKSELGKWGRVIKERGMRAD